MRSPSQPHEVSDKKRQPDEVVEYVRPHGAERKPGGSHRPEPADRSQRFAQETDDHELRIPPRLAGDHPVAIAVETDAHSKAAHYERVIDGRQVKQVEEQVR